MMGDTPGVGTGAVELMPRLLISVESSGIPARAAPPGTVDEVGADDAAWAAVGVVVDADAVDTVVILLRTRPADG